MVSSSKKAELVDSPLSIGAITRQEILEAGITSIPEALNLVAGVINRSQAEGVWDPHIRGFEVCRVTPFMHLYRTLTHW